MDSTQIWLIIVGVALGTFAIRISFLGPWARGALPDWMQRGLRLAPPVIFAALLAPMILVLGQDATSVKITARVLAMAAAVLWALWRGGQLMPIIVGMAVLHLVQQAAALWGR